MRLSYLVLLIPVGLGGCLSYSGTSSPPHETVVVPPGQTTLVPAGSTLVCSNGLRPPC